jgi:hypothetical protein
MCGSFSNAVSIWLCRKAIKHTVFWCTGPIHKYSALGTSGSWSRKGDWVPDMKPVTIKLLWGFHAKIKCLSQRNVVLCTTQWRQGCTEGVDQGGNVSDLYCRDAMLESRPGHGLSWWGLLQSLQTKAGTVPQTRSRPKSFHIPPFDATDSITK